MGRACSQNGRRRSALRIFTGKPTGTRPLGRSRRWWEGNIRIHLKEIGVNKRNCIDSAQDRDYWRAIVNVVLIFLLSRVMELVNTHTHTHIHT